VDAVGLWAWLPFGYAVTVALETPVLWFGLDRRHPPLRRLACGLWLTACTYPVVILVWPAVFSPESQRGLYLLAAETFAPAAECALLLAAFGWRTWPRDCAAVTLANLLSFGVGEVVFGRLGWAPWTG
jgi:hypothetical protein